MVPRCDMGVAPYRWPRNRQWEPGIHDKRANRGIWFVLIIYAIVMIGVIANVGPGPLLDGGLGILLFLFAPLAAWILFFIIGQTSRRDIQMEDLKYFEILPERLSEIVGGVLEDVPIQYERAGPHTGGEDDGSDTFRLLDRPWTGISVLVERNPLIARVDLAAVTIRGAYSGKEEVEQLKDRIDKAGMRELIDRYERGLRERGPELLVYGGE